MVIAENEAPLRGLLRTLLDKDGRCRVVAEAADGRETLRLVEQLDPDRLLLDLGMPGVDGIGVLEVLADRPRPRVVVLTGYADERTSRRAIELGAAACLVKGQDFAGMVDQLVGVSGDHQH